MVVVGGLDAVVASLFVSSTVEVVLGNILYLVQTPFLYVPDRVYRILLALDVTIQICIRYNVRPYCLQTKHSLLITSSA